MEYNILGILVIIFNMMHFQPIKYPLFWSSAIVHIVLIPT